MLSKVIRTDDEVNAEVTRRVFAAAPKLDKEELHKEMKMLRDGKFDGVLAAEESQATRMQDEMDKQAAHVEPAPAKETFSQKTAAVLQQKQDVKQSKLAELKAKQDALAKEIQALEKN